MFKIFLKSKILISIWFISILIVSSLFFFIPYVTEQNIDEIFIENSKNNVTQIKLTRSYYLDFVVNKIMQGEHNLSFSANHKKHNKILPLPATVIHDLSEIYSENMGVKFKTYSQYPFKNRADRILSKKEKETLRTIEKSNGIHIGKDVIDGKPVLRVAIADYMTERSCVECHNHHPDRTWSSTKWKLGDIRGVIEVITPLEKPLARTASMRNKISLFMGLIFAILILYYSYSLVKREEELSKINDILDERVKEEIVKNNEKEQILIQKSKLSSMGQMINNIAHQWRQPISELSSLLINIDINYTMNKLNKKFMEEKIHKGENILEYLSYTIDDFQNFFKPDKIKTSFFVKDVVLNALNISSISSDKHITIHQDIDESIKYFGLKTELSQVLLTIISNAKDALDSENIKNAYVKIVVTQDEKYIYIIISDNAGGINDKHLPKVFDLYFSTKKEGSGVGLYISKLIIEKHFNASIKAENTKEGSRFVISLPFMISHLSSR